MKKLLFLCLVLLIAFLVCNGLAEAGEVKLGDAVSKMGEPQADKNALFDELTEYLNDTLSEMAESANDPLAAVILRSGVSGLTCTNLNSGSKKPVKATFSLKGMNPMNGKLPKYAQNPFDYWPKLLESMNAYSVKVTVTVTPEGNGFMLSDSVRSSLEKTVLKAADKARSGLAGATVKTAIMDLAIPLPVSLSSKTNSIGEDAFSPLFVRFASRYPYDYPRHALACALLSLKDISLDFDMSGDGLVLTAETPGDLEMLMGQALRCTMYDMKRDVNAKEYSYEQILSRLLGSVEQAVLAFRKDKKAQVINYAFDLQFDGEYTEETWYKPIEGYLDSFLEAFERTMENVQAQICGLPDYPVTEEPKTGRLSGSSSGTQVVLKIPKDGFARYVEFRNSNDRKVIALYIRAGEKTKVRLPQGTYYLLIGAGDAWYGPDHLFGENAQYSRTDYCQVPSNKYIYTLTLEPVTNIDDGIPIYDVDLSDLINEG